MANQQITLIPPREAIKILTFVSAEGLRAGSRGTDVLTRYPIENRFLYSKEECESLRDRIISGGRTRKTHREDRERKIPTELI